jgi:hypothetical protein
MFEAEGCAELGSDQFPKKSCALHDDICLAIDFVCFAIVVLRSV